MVGGLGQAILTPRLARGHAGIYELQVRGQAGLEPVADRFHQAVAEGLGVGRQVGNCRKYKAEKNSRSDWARFDSSAWRMFQRT